MNHLPATQVLLKPGSDPTAPDRDLITPIHRAATNGNLDILCLLPQLRNGCSGDRDITGIADLEGWTPLHWAASRGHIAIVELLFRVNDLTGIEVGNLTSSGRTSLHLAAINGHFGITREILYMYEDETLGVGLLHY